MQEKPKIVVTTGAEEATPIKVVTVMKLNEVGTGCDVKGCPFPVVSVWYDSESGSRAFRCAKHK